MSSSAKSTHLDTIVNGVGGFVVNGEAMGDWGGTSVSSAGDVNDDGLGDLIIGARYADLTDRNNCSIRQSRWHCH